MDKIYYVADSTEEEMSPLLESVLKENTESLVNSWDYFSFLLHSLMLETGFKIRDDGHKKRSDCHSFQYELANQEKSLAHCSMNVQKIVGPISKIIGNFHGTDEKESFIYTKNSISDVVEETTFKFKNLRRISKEFKDQISLPLLVKMQDCHSVARAPWSFRPIHQFPTEILIKIAENLSDAKTSWAFAQTCQMFRQVSFDPRLMKALLRRHFPKKYEAAVKENSDPNWYQLYMDAVKEEIAKERRAAQERQEEDLFIPDNFFPFWFPPSAPGFPDPVPDPDGPGFLPMPGFPPVPGGFRPNPRGPGFPQPGFPYGPPRPGFPPGFPNIRFL